MIRKFVGALSAVLVMGLLGTPPAHAAAGFPVDRPLTAVFGADMPQCDTGALTVGARLCDVEFRTSGRTEFLVSWTLNEGYTANSVLLQVLEYDGALIFAKKAREAQGPVEPGNIAFDITMEADELTPGLQYAVKLTLPLSNGDTYTYTSDKYLHMLTQPQAIGSPLLEQASGASWLGVNSVDIASTASMRVWLPVWANQPRDYANRIRTTRLFSCPTASQTQVPTYSFDTGGCSVISSAESPFGAVGVATPRLQTQLASHVGEYLVVEDAVTFAVPLGNAGAATMRLRSAAYPIVDSSLAAVPVVTAGPVVSSPGGATAGSALSVTSGTWTNNPSSYSYQWQVCAKADGSDCTDIAGATSETYTPTDAQTGKYVRVVVTAANAAGSSQQARTTPVKVAAKQDTGGNTSGNTGGNTGGNTSGNTGGNTSGGPAPATGPTAVIGNAQTMELDIPRKTKRRKKKLYEVFFTATDVPGKVTFTFKRKKRVRTVTVPIEDGIAEYRWRTPRKWPRGKTRVTATYVPSAGSPYTAAAVTDRVKVRGR